MLIPVLRVRGGRQPYPDPSDGERARAQLRPTVRSGVKWLTPATSPAGVLLGRNLRDCRKRSRVLLNHEPRGCRGESILTSDRRPPVWEIRQPIGTTPGPHQQATLRRIAEANGSVKRNPHGWERMSFPGGNPPFAARHRAWLRSSRSRPMPKLLRTRFEV